MPTFDDLKNNLPPDTQSLLDEVWGLLSDADKESLKAALSGFPTEANLMKLLVKMTANNLKLAFGGKHKVAIVGPANVGKSTLYNQLIRSKTDVAEVSPLPGTTRINRQADAGVFSVIDTPGADAVGDVGQREKEEALRASKDADFLVIMFDAIQGIKLTERDLFDELRALNKPYIVVINKTDLVRKDTNKVLDHAATTLNLNASQILGISAKDGQNLSKILLAISIAEPQIVAALGSALPEYRWFLARRVIISSASISGVIALSPLPVIDFAPLVINQATMVLGIARVYNYKITLERAKELIATLGMGLVGRMVFQQLSKLGGIPGWLLSVAIASSITVVIGYASATWFESGEKISSETLNKITKDVASQILNSLKTIFSKKPGSKRLQQAVEDILLEITPENEDDINSWDDNLKENDQ